MRQNPKTVVTFSGGMDSTTLLYHLRQQGHEVLALSVDYGQRHRVELDCARRIVESLGLTHEVADLRPITRLLGDSSLTNKSIDVPLGHYAAASMKATVVPNRNMIMLAVAAGWAISQRANHLAYAAHAGDHAIYPDCRPEFADTMTHAIELADWHQVKLIWPFVNMTKAEIATLGHKLGVPFERTWSCYQGGSVHCGACGTCVERREAFMLAGVPDPTAYDPLAPALRTDPNGHLNLTRTINGESTPAADGANPTRTI
jgi:7-cyano-7-deazaguanine synthase